MGEWDKLLADIEKAREARQAREKQEQQRRDQRESVAKGLANLFGSALLPMEEGDMSCEWGLAKRDDWSVMEVSISRRVFLTVTGRWRLEPLFVVAVSTAEDGQVVLTVDDTALAYDTVKDMAASVIRHWGVIDGGEAGLPF